MKQFKFTINGNNYNVTVNKVDDVVIQVEVNGTPYQVFMDKPAKKPAVKIKRPVQPSIPVTGTQSAVRPAGSNSGNAVLSPLPGMILNINCKVGDKVQKGQTLLVLEAMKMENSIPADHDGIVVEIKVKTGDSVMEGTNLVIIA